jgi:hypothetical protein
VADEDSTQASLTVSGQHYRKRFSYRKENIGPLSVRPIEDWLDIVGGAEIKKLDAAIVSDRLFQARRKAHAPARCGDVSGVI